MHVLMSIDVIGRVTESLGEAGNLRRGLCLQRVGAHSTQRRGDKCIGERQE
jgi:hypothetical protein